MRRFFSGSKQIASTDAKVVKDVTRELARLAFTPLCLAPPFYDQISTLLQLNPQTDVIQKAQIVLTKFTSSRRFHRLCDNVFDKVDVDKSGTMDGAELYVAFLLLNHELNKLPLGKRQDPPTREFVLKVLKEHSHLKNGQLSKDDFLAAAQHVCADLSGSIVRNVFCLFVLSPIIGAGAKKLLHDSFSHVHSKAGLLIANIPDALFLPIATAMMTAVMPMILARHDAAVARRAREARQAGAAPPKGLLARLTASLGWMLLPVLLAYAGPRFLAAALEMPGIAPYARMVLNTLQPGMSKADDLLRPFGLAPFANNAAFNATHARK